MECDPFPEAVVGSPWCHMYPRRLLSATALAALARKLRIQYPGTIYRVMNRGERREGICVSKMPGLGAPNSAQPELLNPLADVG